MFGAPVAYFFEYLLGIKQTKKSAGYEEMIISPQALSRFSRMSGSMQTPNGRVAVSYEKERGGIRFSVSIPENCKAIFRVDQFERELLAGNNEFYLAEQRIS